MKRREELTYILEMWSAKQNANGVQGVREGGESKVISSFFTWGTGFMVMAFPMKKIRKEQVVANSEEFCLDFWIVKCLRDIRIEIQESILAGVKNCGILD